MDAVNPATGEVVTSYETDDKEATEQTLERAQNCFTEWRTRPLREREESLTDLAAVLESQTDECARLMTREMGKPISQATAEVEKCVWLCEHYAEYAHSYLAAEQYPSPPGTDVRTTHEPLGPVLAVMPWNYPFWQVLRFAVPALVAGNVGVLSHAPEVPGCARKIEKLFHDAGFPEGAFQTLLIEPDTIHEQLLPDDRIRAATLTGSSAAGSAVAATAGEHLKKMVLELGGSDPFIVLEDADIAAAAETAAWARMQNTGQSCIAAKRVFVSEEIYPEFEAAFLEHVDDLTVGDPTDEGTDVGPLVSERHRDQLHEQVTASIDAGATLVRGGELPDREGAFYPPTVFRNPPQGCPVDAEETFGPVVTLYSFTDVEDAIAIANDSEYGLSASLWTENRRRGRELATGIEAGCVFINEMSKSDPRIPFGGTKRSGYGRELSEAGIKEFVNRKTIWVE